MCIHLRNSGALSLSRYELIGCTGMSIARAHSCMQPALIVPQFDDESSSSDDDSDSERRGAPVYHSPIARKYDDDHDDNNNNSAAVPPPSAAPASTFQGDFQWETTDVSAIQQLTNANAQLASQATEYKRQIKTCACL